MKQTHKYGCMRLITGRPVLNVLSPDLQNEMI